MPRTSQGPSRRFWVGTENHPEDSPLLGLEGDATLPQGVSYCVWQLEKAATGKAHYQCYLELSRGRYVSWLKKVISPTAHWECRKGTAVEASVYCQKEDTRIRGPWILGEPSKGAGTRTDLESFRDAIKEGKRKRDLWDSHCGQMARYRHMYDDLQRTKMPRRTVDLECGLLLGPTGTGKTRAVHDAWVDQGYWRMPVNNGTMWFDGYDGEARVLLDDFAGRMSKISLTMLLQILDRYPIQVPVKGSFTWWLPEDIVITSNVHPKDWYVWGDREEQYLALCRRITQITVFAADGVRKAIAEEDRDEFFDRGDSGLKCYSDRPEHSCVNCSKIKPHAIY